MSTRASRTSVKSGFSLAELSAILASIAVVVAIGAPAASRLSDHQRTTQCLSRVGQMARAFLTYSQDYNGLFPFTSTMQEGDSQSPNEIETWLANWGPYGSAEARAAIATVAHNPEANWPAQPNVPCSGTLFTYTRSADLYRCPEFERVSDPNKAQNAFNFTRPMWARRWKSPIECIMEGSPSIGGTTDGPILRVSDIHKPDELPMVLDEQWNRHVATSGVLGGTGSAYTCNDYGFHPENVIAVSHGTFTASRHHRLDRDDRGFWNPFLWKSGGIAYYDGHAQLDRDPWPTFELGNNRRIAPKHIRNKSYAARMSDELEALMIYMQKMLWAQRGLDISLVAGSVPIPPWPLQATIGKNLSGYAPISASPTTQTCPSCRPRMW